MLTMNQVAGKVAGGVILLSVVLVR